MTSLLAACLQLAPPGYALEFGVATGGTLRQIAEQRPGHTYGFDTFAGLPTDWRDGFPAGMFACEPPNIQGATLVVGMFADTLPPWLQDHRQADIAFVHIDCDLGSSTASVLRHLDQLHPGTVLLFDELTGYPGWERHEHRALLRWVAATGTVLDPVGADGERAAFIVTRGGNR